MAHMLLNRMFMDASPGHVIRALRLALHMSQTEFARATGWAPSTISRWERGQGHPSRLSMKMILAFAEGRGVRYRPKQKSQPLVPVPVSGPPALLQRSAARSAGALTLQRTSEVNERFVRVTANRPLWSADASLRISFGRSAQPSDRRGIASTLRAAGIVAATLCIVIAVGRPERLERPAAPAPPHSEPTRTTVVEAEAQPPAARVSHQAPDTPPVRPSPESAVRSLARLDGVVMIGEQHRAMFRTPAHSVTLSEGSWIGRQQVDAIDPDRVHLITRSGKTRTLHLGHEAVVD